MLGGMTAGAVLLDAPYLPAFVAFVLPILAPASIAFAMRGDEASLAMGLMLVAFTIVHAVVGWRANREIVDTLRLQAQRENLTADLYRTTAELTRREAILRIMANHDQLTGLFNRHYLLETLERELARAQRRRPDPGRRPRPLRCQEWRTRLHRSVQLIAHGSIKTRRGSCRG